MLNISKRMMNESRAFSDGTSMFGMNVSNSSAVITDLGTAVTAWPYSATATANSIAAAGPITDLRGALEVCQLHAQEMVKILSYILEGSAVQTSLTAPTGGLITSSSDSSTYNTLVGVYQILK